jgi:hypothetical protein
VERHTKQISPWLDQAGWETYLQPYNHVELLPLLDPPSLSKSGDYILLLLWASFNQIIEAARESIKSDKINIFDLHIAISFHKRKTNEFTLQYKLQETTYDSTELSGNGCFVSFIGECGAIQGRSSPTG